MTAFSGRRVGKTAAAIMAAPHGATFVWGHDNLAFATSVAAELGRADLKFMAPSELVYTHGLAMAMAIDPYANLTNEQLILIYSCHARWEQQRARILGKSEKPAPAKAGDDSSDLLEIARTICAVADQLKTMSCAERAAYPSPLSEFSPMVVAARGAVEKRGYTAGGLLPTLSLNIEGI